MFSTIPRTGMDSISAIFLAFPTTICTRDWGVETTMVPSKMCIRDRFQIFPDTESAGLRIEHRDKCRIASVKIDRYLFPAAFGEGAQIIRKGDFQFLIPPRVAVGGGERCV